jgi:pyrimidine-nucleoside phosphorylase
MITAVEAIRTKRDGGTLTPAMIDAFVSSAARGGWETYQLSALLMAIFLRGLSAEETAYLTKAMTDSGDRIDLSDVPGPKVDKHSTGGVGDKTSLILAPLAAACGVVVPMMSGRGLGHTGGTLDKLDAIPGFRTGLSLDEFKTALRTTGVGMIGQTSRVVPADKTLYALRDVTGTVESIPLITASILSKKLAEGISGLVLDVKVGSGAFMKTTESARLLARSLVDGARANGLRCGAILSDMESPLGRAVGNANEVAECIETLKGRGPKDLETLSLLLSARMVRMAGLADTDEQAAAKVRRALDSGEGLDRFRRIVEHQGGDARVVDDSSRLPRAPHSMVVRAGRSGHILKIDAESVGLAACRLGAGRRAAEDAVDTAVGVTILVLPGERISSGDPLFEVAYRDEATLAEAVPLLSRAVEVDNAPPAPRPLVIEEIAP